MNSSTFGTLNYKSPVENISQVLLTPLSYGTRSISTNNTILYSSQDVERLIEEARESVDTIWMITTAVWIMMMQLGFAMFEAGSIRAKNTSNILLKSVIDIFTGFLAFFFCGYGMMTALQGGIIGTGPFLGQLSTRRQILDFLFSYSFCATSTTIVSGAMAERIYVDSYIAYSMLMTGFIYPVGAGWAWGNGWLQIMGYRDYSGSGVVHMVGGVAGLIGTCICGPRLGIFGKHIKPGSMQRGCTNYHETVDVKEKSQSVSSYIEETSPKVAFKVQEQILFENSSDLPMPERVRIFKKEFTEFTDYDNESVSHLITLYDQNFDKKFQYYSITLIVSGTYLLWVCWLFFNASAGKTITKRGSNNIPHMTIMNTMICGSVSSLVVFYLYPYFMKERDRISSYNPVNICNGLLAGLVSITASCNNVENYSAFVIGIVSGLIYIFSCRLFVYLKIDDPCCASQIHGICGAWGVIALGFFDRQTGLINTGNFKQLGVQCLGVIALAGWSACMTIPYFYLLNKIQRLRVSPLYEIIGMDILMHEEKEKLSHISQQTFQVLEEQRRARALYQNRLMVERRQSIILKQQMYDAQRRRSQQILNVVESQL